MAFHDEARRAGGGRASETDHAAALISSEFKLSEADAQALIEALAGYDLARTAILIADDHVRSFGIGPLHDLPVILETRCCAIRLALDGGAA